MFYFYISLKIVVFFFLNYITGFNNIIGYVYIYIYTYISCFLFFLTVIKMDTSWYNLKFRCVFTYKFIYIWKIDARVISYLFFKSQIYLI